MRKKDTSIILIKSVRVRLDHIEKIIKWLENDMYDVSFKTFGIDDEVEDFEDIDTIINKKGNHPKNLTIFGQKENSTILISFTKLYCAIQTDQYDSETVKKIRKMMRKSVRKLYRIISFKTYSLFVIGLFLAYLILFIISTTLIFNWKYLIFTLSALLFAAIVNNSVNNIYLIRAHENIGVFYRIKDTMVKAILTTFIIVPLSPEIIKLFKYLLKYLN